MKREARVITHATKKIRQNKDFVENPFFVLGTHNTNTIEESARPKYAADAFL